MERDKDYAAGLHRAQREYAELLQQRDEIEKRITLLKQYIVTTSTLLGEELRDVETGLTEGIRQLLRAAGPDGLSSREIESKLPTIGIVLPKNPRVAIHVTLKRLMDANQVEQFRDAKSAKRYRWLQKDVVINVPAGTITLTGPFAPALTSQPLGSPFVLLASEQPDAKQNEFKHSPLKHITDGGKAKKVRTEDGR